MRERIGGLKEKKSRESRYFQEAICFIMVMCELVNDLDGHRSVGTSLECTADTNPRFLTDPNAHVRVLNCRMRGSLQYDWLMVIRGREPISKPLCTVCVVLTGFQLRACESRPYLLRCVHGNVFAR